MRIMVVEDEVKLAGYLKKGLEEEQYAVDVFYDGVNGLYWGKENTYDIIILDVMLPGLNGFQVCEKLRQEGVQAPIIMLTAKDTPEDKVKGLDYGADDYLAKPFSFSELLARIRAILRRSSDYKIQVLTIDNLILDPVTQKVTREGKSIDLSGKEYALLEYLLRNQGKILTETNLLEHVWDMNSENMTNVVNVYIHYLRNKIDKGYEKKLIHTIRSRGYIMKDDDNDTIC